MLRTKTLKVWWDLFCPCLVVWSTPGFDWQLSHQPKQTAPTEKKNAPQNETVCELRDTGFFFFLFLYLVVAVNKHCALFSVRQHSSGDQRERMKMLTHIWMCLLARHNNLTADWMSVFTACFYCRQEAIQSGLSSRKRYTPVLPAIVFDDTQWHIMDLHRNIFRKGGSVDISIPHL